jgi:hypothetical protein
MAGTRTARLRVEIDADNKAGPALKDAAGDTKSVGKGIEGMAAAAAAAAGVVAFFGAAAEAASRLQQSTGGVEAVFKSSAGQVKQWAQAAAQSVGLSQSAYQDLATTIGSQLKNAGVAMSELAPKTDDLIRQGADLAAMFGGTTADAVAAMSSALKGERDPIEKYGISITDVALKAEMAALGLDTSTAAAEQNAKAMATMSLITKQGADAWGAAEREQDSYASSQQRLAATWENVMAAIGGPLLGILADLGDKLAEAALAVAPLLVAAAELVGWLLDLPGPILAAVAAFVAWKAVGPAVLGFLGNFATAATGAGTAAYGMGQKIGSAVKSLGVLLILAAVTYAISEIIGAFKDAEEATKRWNTQVTDLGTALKDVDASGVDALVQSSIAGNDAFKAVAGASQDYALAMKGVTDGASLTAAEHDKLKSTLEGLDPALALEYTRLQNLKGEALASAESQRALDVANRAAAEGISEASAAAAISADEQAKLAEEQAKAAVEGAKLAAEQTTVAGVLNTVDAAAAQASRALQFFTIMMDAAAGRTPTMEQASAALNESIRGTAEAFKTAGEAGKVNGDELAAWDVAALTSSESGAKLYDALSQSRNAYDAVTVAAYENAGGAAAGAAATDAARAAADGAYTSFINLATGAGLGAEQAAALAAKLGIVQGTQIDPKIFDVLAADEQAQTALTDLQSTQIDPKSVLVDATITDATAAIGSVVNDSYLAWIDSGAKTDQAAGQINNVAKANYQATIKTDSQTQQASSQIDTVATKGYRATIQVDSNVSAALSSIANVVNSHFSATIQVSANTTAASQSIAAVTNGNYTATIQVGANTSGALSAIAAIPRNVAVSVTPSPAPAAAAAPSAAFGLFTAAPAGAAPPPPVTRYPTGVGRAGDENNTVGTTTINISVSGADDPDKTARRIAAVLRQRERRAGGVRI